MSWETPAKDKQSPTPLRAAKRTREVASLPLLLRCSPLVSRNTDTFVLAGYKKDLKRAFWRVQTRSGWALSIDPDRYGIVLAGSPAAARQNNLVLPRAQSRWNRVVLGLWNSRAED